MDLIPQRMSHESGWILSTADIVRHWLACHKPMPSCLAQQRKRFDPDDDIL